MEAVEQQGRRKGDSGCLFQVRGQFCSVPLQLEEHLSTLTSANHSSAAPREAYLTEVLLTVFPSRDERRHCHFQNQYSSEEIGRDVVVDIQNYIFISSASGRSRGDGARYLNNMRLVSALFDSTSHRNSLSYSKFPAGLRLLEKFLGSFETLHYCLAVLRH